MDQHAKRLIVEKAREFSKDARNAQYRDIAPELYFEARGYMLGVLNHAEYEPELWAFGKKVLRAISERRYTLARKALNSAA